MQELQCPVQTLTWENDIMSCLLSQTSSFAGQFPQNGLGTLIFHSEAAAALLDGCVLPINAPQLPPSSLLAC